MEYASNSKANLGVALGAVGTGLSALSGMGVLGGFNGLGTARAEAIEDRCVTRHELDLIREIMTKDQAIAIEKSENYTDKKLVEVYSQLAKQDKETNARIDANYKEQAAINLAQATYNATNNATLNCMQNQIAQLMSLTALRIPNTSVCPGWGPVTVTPGGGTTVA